MTILGASINPLPASPPPTQALSHGPDPLWSSSLAPVAISYFDNDLLEISFEPGTALTLPMMQEILESLTPRLETKTGHLLVSICGINNVDAEAARVFSKISTTMRVVLLGAGPADRVLARFFMRNLPADLPCRYTEGREEAMAFLYES